MQVFNLWCICLRMQVFNLWWYLIWLLWITRALYIARMIQPKSLWYYQWHGFDSKKKTTAKIETISRPNSHDEAPKWSGASQIFSLVGGFNPFEKNISQNGNLPQIGVKIKNIWNHHPVDGRLGFQVQVKWYPYIPLLTIYLRFLAFDIFDHSLSRENKNSRGPSSATVKTSSNSARFGVSWVRCKWPQFLSNGNNQPFHEIVVG